MADLNLQPLLVGRDKDLHKLHEYLDRAKSDIGGTLFITGEAGVGKTRLVTELREIAQAKGFQTFIGNSIFESLTPFMPMIDALRSGGLESLFAQEFPKVECVFLVSQSGLLITDVIRQETQLNTDIFAGMLTTVGNFVQDSLSILTDENKEGTLNTLGYENFRILIESGLRTNLAVIISGKENEFLLNDMKEISINVEQTYGDKLESWDGDDKNLGGIRNILEPLITSGKYDGIDYVKDDPKIKRNLLFENILLGINRYTKVNPSLLCIEDLQWADSSSIALLHYIARNTRKSKLLIVGTYRPEDVIETKKDKVHYLIDTMQLMNREDIYNKIELDRLEESCLDEMLSSILGDTEFTNEFMAQIYKETEGNPFFIISLIRMMIEEKSIEKKNEKWVLKKDLKEANIPSKIQDVLERRLNRVEKVERKTLDYASVIGEEFTSSILGKAVGIKRVELLEQLRTLEQNHKLIRSTDSKYRFDHGKINEVLYNKIPTELKMEYHALIAGAIESLNKDNLDAVLGGLAGHYYRCRNKEKALPYLFKAAKKATNHYAHHESLEYYGFALDMIESSEDSTENIKKKLEIIMAMGNNYYSIGEWDDALKLYHQATKISDIVNDDKSKAEAYRNIGLIHKNRNEWEEAKLYFNKGIKISEKIKDSQLTAELYHCLGKVSDEKGEIDDAKKYYGKCMEIAVNNNDSSEIADAYLGIGRLFARKGEYEESIIAFKKAVEILKDTQDLDNLAKAYANLGATNNFVNPDRGIEYHNKAIEIADKIKNIRIKGYGLMNLANIFIEKNDLETASSQLKTALEIFEKLGEKLSISSTYVNYGSIHRLRQEWDKASEYFEKSLKIVIELDTPYNIGDVLYEYGRMFKDKGDVTEAKKRLTKSLEVFENIQNKEMIEKVQSELSTL
jgi:tetratricopeptide (TPR) repeat protein